jgi:hypothetical protein
MTAAEIKARPRGLWDVLTWPVGPVFIVGRRTSRPRARAMIAASGLPEEIQRTLQTVVSRARLWSREQRDVARELVAHFADALAAGVAPEKSVQDFGDPQRAAQMIRRAKRRNRPLLWQLWMRTWQAMGVCVVAVALVYVALALRYYTASPVIARNYLAEINAPALNVPEPERAWPVYRRALLGAPVLPPSLGPGNPDWHTLRLDDPRWPRVEEYLTKLGETLELTREATGRPHLGVAFSTAWDEELMRHRALLTEEPEWVPPPQVAEENPPLFTVLLPHLSELRRLSRNLEADARRAARQGDAKRVVADLAGLLGLARHMDEVPFSISGMVALSCYTGALRATLDILEERPEVLGREDLRALAHLLAAFAGGGNIRIDLREDPLFVEDALQRAYSDDGRGDGRLTPKGVELLKYFDPPISLSEMRALAGESFDKVQGPVIAAAVASRREVMREHKRIFEAYEAEASRPMWEWGRAPGAAALGSIDAGPWKMRYRVLSSLLPAFLSLAVQGENVTQERDATLTAIALELYRRDHGEYPQSLDALAPAYIPAIPPDRVDGCPLRYLLRDGRPLLYSIGIDGVDDRGIPPANEPAREAVRRYPTRPGAPPVLADWILWPRERGNTDAAPPVVPEPVP